MNTNGSALTLKLRCCGAVQQRETPTLRRLAKYECHEYKEPVEQESLLHAGVQAGVCEPRLHSKDIHTSALPSEKTQLLCTCTPGKKIDL